MSDATADPKEDVMAAFRHTPDVWAAFEPESGDFQGFYVSDGHPDKPVAFLPGWMYAGRDEGLGREALRLAAETIAADHEAAATTPDCIDLRGYGHTHSRLPTPHFLYDLVLGTARSLNPRLAVVRPFPFCPFRLHKLVAQFADYHFADDDKLNHPVLCIGIFQPDGDGHVDTGQSKWERLWHDPADSPLGM